MRDQEIVDLYEAYASIYASEGEIEQLHEAREASHDPEGYEERQRRSQSSRERRMNDPHTGINSPAFHEFMRQQMGGGRRPRKKKVDEGYDLFDHILEHLVAEGYADTNEAALVIMANMSEEWRQSIVEEVEQLNELSLKTMISAAGGRGTNDFESGETATTKSGKSKFDQTLRHIERKHGPEAVKHAVAATNAKTFGRTDPRTGKRQERAKPRIEKNRTYRTTKAGKMHVQDQKKLKRDLKYNRFVED